MVVDHRCAHELLDCGAGLVGKAPQSHFADRDLARSILFSADCWAIAQMQREGALRGYRGYSAIAETFEFQRARMSYLDVPFIERLENIRERCPL